MKPVRFTAFSPNGRCRTASGQERGRAGKYDVDGRILVGACGGEQRATVGNGGAKAPRPRPFVCMTDRMIDGCRFAIFSSSAPGPSGLATAISAKAEGLDFEVIEKGVLVNSIFHFPVHMVFFTTPELLEIGGLPLVTPVRQAHTHRGAALLPPRGREIPAADVVRRTGLSRDRAPRDDDPLFTVTTRGGRASPDPAGARDRARHRLLRSSESAERRPARICRTSRTTTTRPTATIASGSSSSVARTRRPRSRSSSIAAGAHVTLVHRRAALGSSIKYWVKPDIENRIAEGSIAARFESRVVEITARGGGHRLTWPP